MHSLQQVGVPDGVQPDGGGVPGEPDHQLGRHRLGGQERHPVGGAGDPGWHQPHGGPAPSVPRLQG